MDPTIVDTAGQPAPAAQPAAVVKTPEPTPPAFADLLAQHRAEKTARTKAVQEAEGIKAKLAAVEAELEKSRTGRRDLITDPVGYLRSLGVTDDELPLIGEAVMYERMPDKAPATLRARMLEAKIARKEREEKAEKERESATSAQRAEAEAIARYRDFLSIAASAEADKFPISAAWFADQDEYVDSLMHTAHNLSAEAEKHGETADLSPAAVRKVLEDYLAERAGRLPGRAAEPKVVPKADSNAVQVPEWLRGKENQPPRGVSAQGAAGQSGGPRPPAKTEAERRQRAIEAMEAAERAAG